MLISEVSNANNLDVFLFAPACTTANFMASINDCIRSLSKLEIYFKEQSD